MRVIAGAETKGRGGGRMAGRTAPRIDDRWLPFGPPVHEGRPEECSGVYIAPYSVGGVCMQTRRIFAYSSTRSWKWEQRFVVVLWDTVIECRRRDQPSDN